MITKHPLNKKLNQIIKFYNFKDLTYEKYIEKNGKDMKGFEGTKFNKNTFEKYY